jgi:serine acetyltransferase
MTRPWIVLSGGVHAGVVTGATLNQARRVGAQSTVGAGALVLRDVMAGTTVLGLPAEPRRS